jgi:hypothetical protein
MKVNSKSSNQVRKEKATLQKTVNHFCAFGLRPWFAFDLLKIDEDRV